MGEFGPGVTKNCCNCGNELAGLAIMGIFGEDLHRYELSVPLENPVYFCLGTNPVNASTSRCYMERKRDFGPMDTQVVDIGDPFGDYVGY